MLVSLNWLKDYVDISLTPQELAHTLTMAGLEVDDIKTIRPNFSGVVVAKILSVRPHPSADRLSLCEVTDGTETYKIVCGAKNITAGDTVPLARVGASIPGGYTIKSSVLRGETSDWHGPRSSRYYRRENETALREDERIVGRYQRHDVR